MRMAGKPPAYFLNTIIWHALDLFYPPTCVGCGQVGACLCHSCEQKVNRITGPVCQCCGDPLPPGRGSSNQDLTCRECQVEKPPYQTLRSYAIFDSVIKESLHRLKYQRDIGQGYPLSKHLVELYNELKWDVDLIAPVPLSSKRLRERGYNQTEYLAKPLAYAISKPYRPGIVQRTRDTRSQVELSAKERQANVAGAFTADAVQVKGKTILMIDDVMTTGATFGACAQALRNAGASAVFGLTLARAANRAGQ